MEHYYEIHVSVVSRPKYRICTSRHTHHRYCTITRQPPNGKSGTPRTSSACGPTSAAGDATATKKYQSTVSVAHGSILEFPTPITQRLFQRTAAAPSSLHGHGNITQSFLHESSSNKQTASSTNSASHTTATPCNSTSPQRISTKSATHIEKVV